MEDLLDGLIVKGGGVLNFLWDAVGMVTSTQWKGAGKPGTVISVRGIVVLAA